MKNQIYTNEENGKFACYLYSYEETPSGNIRPIIRVSSEFVFDSASAAANHLYESLKPGVKENTEISIKTRRVYLVACAATKLPGQHPAKDLYNSELFRKSRAVAEKFGNLWFILSAKHHLVSPDKILDSYDQSLNYYSRGQISDWGYRVREKLKPLITADDIIVILAGNKYAKEVYQPFINWGYKVKWPLKGRGIGQQLAWLKSTLENGAKDDEI